MSAKIGLAMILYALVVYPAIGWARGTPLLDGPTFGAPCPLVIYTFGMLLLARAVPLVLLPIPLAWAAIGTSAIVAFDIVPDVGLPAAAVAAVVLTWRSRRTNADVAPTFVTPAA